MTSVITSYLKRNSMRVYLLSINNSFKKITFKNKNEGCSKNSICKMNREEGI